MRTMRLMLTDGRNNEGNNIMRKSKNNFLKGSIIGMFLLALIIVFSSAVIASNNTYEIRNLQDLLYASLISKTDGHQDDTFVLMNDITITSEDQAMLDANGNSIIFGDSSHPFSGIFDGNGYTIYNLEYDDSFPIAYDTGFFSQTDGATIRDLTLDSANIETAYRGGILIGRADNTTVVNVTVRNSTLTISVADNILTLITDGGVRGGALAGEAYGSIFYNCEGSDNTIINDNTSAIQALAGKPINVGGLVGVSNNSEIEYSRVYDGLVSASYGVAVSAVGGNTLYVGGIAGQMKDASKIIDSFSTTELYFYCATYVSVAAGNEGHIGGITAKMDGNANEIIRSHYAGVTSSRQYNAVLVVPIIQDNQNISGIADISDGGSVVNSYFKPSLNPNVNMNVIGDATSTTAYGPVTDENYASKEFWQDAYYDFLGNVRRSSSYDANHNNKWVMDTGLGIPVHGKSFSATFDFPGAGEVSIGATELINHSTSTSNPYYFAVQGTKPNEQYADIEATENTGYRFVAWYKVANVTAWSTDTHEYFENVVNTGTPVSNNRVYSNVQIADNDLFIGHYEARVRFHDVGGNIIDTSGAQDSSGNEVYYDYGDTLPDVEPVNRPSGATAKLIGWTTIASGTGGYSSITQPELEAIKNADEFYTSGDSIYKAMDLYPIYTDLASNIVLIFEGNEQDASSIISERVGVGSLTLEQDNNGNITLKVMGSNAGSLPDGYRFLGWYNSDNARVSKDLNYQIGDDVDITTTQTFTARFEYRVNYYVRAYAQDGEFGTSELYKETWVRYNTAFVNIPAPGYIREYITHWGTQHVNHGNNNSEADAYVGNIVAPINVYSHNYTTATGGSSGYQLSADVDFRGSGTVTDQNRNAGALLQFTPVSNGYNFLFWTLQRSNNDRTYANNPMDTGMLSSLSNYMARAFVTADVLFHKKGDNDVTVQRRYQDNVFSAAYTHTYKYPFFNSSSDINTSTSDGATIAKTYTFDASPTDNSMAINGYAFLGWVSNVDVAENSAEWNYIYDVQSDAYCSSNIHKSQPYLIDQSSALVEQTMDLYPVYAKYNIATTTNIPSVNASDINTPNNPAYSFIETSTGVGTVTITPDVNVPVVTGEPAIYNLASITVSKNGGPAEIMYQNGQGLYTYEIEAGPEYVFTANYEPYLVVYHLNNNDTSVEIKNMGDSLGVAPDPTYDVSLIGNNVVFVGYTDTAPAHGYHLFNDLASYNNSGLRILTPSVLVNNSLELWPVYIEAGISLNSNIDSVLDADLVDKDTIYGLGREDISTISANILSEDYNNYHFIGWYQDYVDDTDYGTLVSRNGKYILDQNVALSSDTLTAVYKTVYRLNYYGTDNNIFETVYVPGDTSRSFVITELDSDNNPVEVMVDGETVLRFLNQLNPNIFLNEYNWIQQNGTITHWNDYKNTIISADMNLYPAVKQFTAYDSQNTALDSVGSAGSPADILYAKSDNNVAATLNTLYDDSSLRVHAELITYIPNSSTTSNIDNLNIDLFTNASLAQADYSENTNSSGDAIYNLFHNIAFSRAASSINKSTISIFTITDTNTNAAIDIVLNHAAPTTVKMPYGNYSISEDGLWSWRDDSYSYTFAVNNMSSSPVEISNSELSQKWFDGMDFEKNIFSREGS